MSFVRRLIEVRFTLGTFLDHSGVQIQRAFDEGGDTVTLSGLRISAKIVKAGGASMGNAQLVIFGMTPSVMNQLSTLGLNPQIIGANFVKVFAGDEGGAMSLVYDGTITNAWQDLNASPNVGFHVEAHTGLFQSMMQLPPSSYKGPADVAEILLGLADRMGVPFENNSDVHVILDNPYFEGSPRLQALAVVEHAGIEWNGLDDGILAIWPRGGVREGRVTVISPETGMVGYPTYSSKGIVLKILFTPSLRYGAAISVDSSLIPAIGRWKAFTIAYDLESLVPNGAWFTTIEAARPWLVVVK